MITLKELLLHDSIGSLNEILFIITLIETSKRKSVNSIIDYSMENYIESRISVNGILQLLEFICFIKIKNNRIILDGQSEFYNIVNENEKRLFLIDIILSKIIEDNFFIRHFSLDLIEYDDYKGRFIVKNNFFPIKLSPIKNLLISFKCIKYDYETNNLIINDDNFLELLSKKLPSFQKNKTIDDLKKELELREKFGNDAEVYVIEFEKRRLSGHPRIGNIIRISQINVTAGYDILSYSDSQSKKHDRYIEVKSFSGIPRFHFSRNEIKISKIKQKHYYLYLVDRDCYGDKEYEPIIIRDPYHTIFNNNTWERDCDDWVLKKKL
jgi:hypothetical protein